MRKRSAKDIWQGLYEFILLETEQILAYADLLKTELFISLFNKKKYSLTDVSNAYKQQLTHQTINGKFFHIKINSPIMLETDLILVTKEQISHLPFPKFIASYLID